MTVVMGELLVDLRPVALFITIAACGETPGPLPASPRPWTAATPRVVEHANAALEGEPDAWLRSAIGTGVPVSDRTALAVIGGDLVAFDRTTLARSIVAPAIAAGQRCVGVRTATDALFVCTDDSRACVGVGVVC